jgi:hypothetical protein
MKYNIDIHSSPVLRTQNNNGKNNKVFRDGRNLSMFQRNMLPPSSWWKSEDGDSTFLLNVRKLLPDSVTTLPRTYIYFVLTTARIPNVRS